MIQLHIEAELARVRAAMAANAHLPDDQLRLRPRRVLAPPRLPARHLRPAPGPSRQFAWAPSTQVGRDRRLPPRCAGLALVLVAQAGRGRIANITRPYLARTLQVCERTVARLLAELRERGYIVTTHRLNPIGQTIGLKVELLDPLLAYFDGDDDINVPPITPKILTIQRGKFRATAQRKARGLQEGQPSAPNQTARPPPKLLVVSS